MDKTNLRDVLVFNVSMGLKRHKYVKPRDNDASANDRYYWQVAEAIVEQLRLTWEFTRKSDGGKV